MATRISQFARRLLNIRPKQRKYNKKRASVYVYPKIPKIELVIEEEVFDSKVFKRDELTEGLE